MLIMAKANYAVWVFLLLASLVLPVPQAMAQSPTAGSTNGAQILEEFGRQTGQCTGRSTSIAQHERQIIMFSIGAALLVLLLSTAGVGVAVGVMGKPLFIPHMILAGLTVTLAIVHVIVGMVWFYPF